ncbi:hypothetical protein KCU83_g21, partial [Aureobasidium melanogenum]
LSGYVQARTAWQGYCLCDVLKTKVPRTTPSHARTGQIYRLERRDFRYRPSGKGEFCYLRAQTQSLRPEILLEGAIVLVAEVWSHVSNECMSSKLGLLVHKVVTKLGKWSVVQGHRQKERDRMGYTSRNLLSELEMSTGCSSGSVGVLGSWREEAVSLECSDKLEASQRDDRMFGKASGLHLVNDSC